MDIEQGWVHCNGVVSHRGKIDGLFVDVLDLLLSLGNDKKKK